MDIFAYLVGCKETREALVIDPAAEVEGIVKKAEDENLKVSWIINTHPHGDHTGGNRKAKKLFEAQIAVHRDAEQRLETCLSPGMAMMIGGDQSPPPDRLLDDDEDLKLGKLSFKVLHTPGHCPGSICLYGHGAVFTGDVLFVGGVGRTDLPGGSTETLKSSIKEKLMTLPDDTIVYPGHDYGETETSTVREERASNYFIR